MASRRLAPIIVALALLPAGCSLRGRKPQPVAAAPKPAPVPAPAPSGPLSTPQTRVDLPAEQPLDPRALATAPENPPPEPEPPPARTPPRRPAPPPAAAGAQAPLPAAPVEPLQPPVEERPRVQEALSAEEKRRITDDIATRKREIGDILQQASRRNLSEADRGIVERVRSFVQMCDQAAARGELRQADALSERAVVMSRELRNVR
jgi:hypothetical protein